MHEKFGVIILAAGASGYRQKPKQLLPYLGRTLVEHAARTALASGASEVIVVVGADATAIREELRNLPVCVVSNRDWKEGIASSIRCGIQSLGTSVECSVIALCDQPKMTPGLIRELAQRQMETGVSIVASAYDGVVGAPSAFGKQVFPELLALEGERGARDLIRQSLDSLETIEFDGGNVAVGEPSVYRPVLPTEDSRKPIDFSLPPREARGPPLVNGVLLFAA